MKSAQPPRKRLRLYSRLDARFDDRDEDPRASLVNLVDVMLVFACGLLGRIALSQGGKARSEGNDGGHQAKHRRDAGEQVGTLKTMARNALDELQIARCGKTLEAPEALAECQAGFGQGNGAGHDECEKSGGEQPGNGLVQPGECVVHRGFTGLLRVEEKRRPLQARPSRKISGASVSAAGGMPVAAGARRGLSS